MGYLQELPFRLCALATQLMPSVHRYECGLSPGCVEIDHHGLSLLQRRIEAFRVQHHHAIASFLLWFMLRTETGHSNGGTWGGSCFISLSAPTM